MDLYCIKSHRKKYVVKGKIYPLLGERKIDCCNFKAYNVGVKTDVRIVECDCGNVFLTNGIAWIHQELFANIDDINIEEAIEALEELQEV